MTKCAAQMGANGAAYVQRHYARAAVGKAYQRFLEAPIEPSPGDPQ